jgi:hypothetical protein
MFSVWNFAWASWSNRREAHCSEFYTCYYPADLKDISAGVLHGPLSNRFETAFSVRNFTPVDIQPIWNTYLLFGILHGLLPNGFDADVLYSEFCTGCSTDLKRISVRNCTWVVIVMQPFSEFEILVVTLRRFSVQMIPDMRNIRNTPVHKMWLSHQVTLFFFFTTEQKVSVPLQTWTQRG